MMSETMNPTSVFECRGTPCGCPAAAGTGGDERGHPQGVPLLLLSLLLGACSPGSSGSGDTPSPLPDVTTGSASALGTTAMTVNGSVHPHGRYTTTYFEYGLSTEYGSRTEDTPLPPRLGAVYHETWDQGLGGWASWLESESFDTGGAEGGFVRFSEPSGHDRNHDDGIGTLHLTKYLWTGSLGSGEDTDRAWLGGGDPDLRGARVSLWARGNDWQPNGSEVLWWTQSQSNIELGHQPGWRRANWAYTGHTLTDQLLDGRWNLVDYRLLNDSSQWTYGGNNPTLQGESAARYAYWSIDQAQAHVNCDFFHLVATVDIDNPPTGSLDFDDFRLVYRNHSLVYPSNGGRLIRWPEGAAEAPAQLTDGWRHGPGRIWRSGSRPDRPQEFVFALDREVTVKTIQVHQNPEWPGKQVEVLASADDRQYEMLAALTLPKKGEQGPNFAFALETGLAAQARYLKFRLLSGYREEHWGLGEIEVFGSGARMLPDDDLYYVNTDLEGLTPGATVHYRLVASNHGRNRLRGGPDFHRSRRPQAPCPNREGSASGRPRGQGPGPAQRHGTPFPFSLRIWEQPGVRFQDTRAVRRAADQPPHGLSRVPGPETLDRLPLSSSWWPTTRGSPTAATAAFTRDPDPHNPFDPDRIRFRAARHGSDHEPAPTAPTAARK